MPESIRRGIIKILCLYVGTSGVFLCIFFALFYAKEERHLIAQQISNLREISLEVYGIFHANKGDMPSALRQIEVQIKEPLRIYDKGGVILYDRLKDALGGVELTPKELREGFALRGERVFIEPSVIEFSIFGKMPPPQVKSRPLLKPKEPRYRIFIQDNALDSELLFLRLKFIAYLLFSLLAVGVVAYFLVRLFLKPMQEKINSLNAFIKDSTHEINTPLSIILMSIETLGSETLSPAQRRKIQRIKLAAQSLSHLHKDLVAYNFPHSIEGEKHTLELKSLLEERLEYFAPFFEQKELRVKSDIGRAQIVANSEKISCVVDNLLSNAIKYTPKGGEIYIRLSSPSDTPHSVGTKAQGAGLLGRLEVSDSGCGFDMKDREKIFIRYERCNDFQGGFGIGLALVKRICDESGIHIEAQSEQGKGSSFILTW